MIIYFRLGDEIKDTLTQLNEEDIRMFDFCMVGEKEQKK